MRALAWAHTALVEAMETRDDTQPGACARCVRPMRECACYHPHVFASGDGGTCAVCAEETHADDALVCDDCDRIECLSCNLDRRK
jgi:hypothetical protein